MPKKNLIQSSFYLAIFAGSLAQAQAFNSAEEFDCLLEPSLITDVGSSVPGVLSQVTVERGESVDKGGVVARLESSVEEKSLDLVQRKAESRLAVELHKVMSAYGQRTQKRNALLASAEAISDQDLDQVATDSKVAQLRLQLERENRELAQLEYEQAKAVLERKTIYSPISGVVMERYKSVGEFVDENPIARIAQLDPLHVQTILPVELMGKIRIGQQAQIGISIDDYAPNYRAVVSLVDRVADAPSSTFSVRLALQNKDHAIPAGVRCRVSFSEQQDAAPAPSNTVKVASSAAQSDKPAEKARETISFLSAPAAPKPSAASAPEAPAPSAEAAPEHLAETQVAETAAAELVETAQTSAERDPAAPAPLDFKAIAASVGMGVEDSNSCYYLGPLANPEQVSALLAKVDQLEGLVATPTEGGAQQYMVLSREGGWSLLDVDSLKARGINDLFQIARGSNRGKVSFGLYSDRAKAESRVEQLEALSVAAEAVPRQRGRQWLRIMPIDEQADISGLKALQTSTVKLQQRACEG